eukprot:gene10800-14499_t
MDWKSYLSKGTPKVIYHMCNKSQFESIDQNGLYFPPTFPQDGFIHATEDPSSLLPVGTHFYKEDIGDWICLKLNPQLLAGEVIYEAPAPVGAIAAFDHAEKNNNQPLFPHIYGGIPKLAVMNIYPIVRNSDGIFLSIPGLC